MSRIVPMTLTLLTLLLCVGPDRAEGQAGDPAERAYREARAALTAESYAEAIRLLQELRRAHARSTYVADSHYYEALARARLAQRLEEVRGEARTAERVAREAAEHRRAGLELLERLMGEYPDARMAREAAVLAERLRSRTAEGQGRRSQCPPGEMGTREAALHALLQTEPQAAGEILRELAGDPDPCAAVLRRAAIFSVMQSPGSIPLETLTALAEGDQDRSVREAAVHALGRHPAPGGTEVLARMARSADEAVSRGALWALMERSDPAAREVLWEVAEWAEAGHEARTAAVHALTREVEATDLARLQRLFQRTDSEELQRQIVFSVARHGGSNVRGWLMELARDPATPREVRVTALLTGTWEGRSGELVALFRSLEAGDPLRQDVLFTLVRLSDEAATEGLIEIVRELPEGPLLRDAIFALGQRDDPRVRELLRELVREGRPR
jgi:hypothetical protein